MFSSMRKQHSCGIPTVAESGNCVLVQPKTTFLRNSHGRWVGELCSRRRENDIPAEYPLSLNRRIVLSSRREHPPSPETLGDTYAGSAPAPGPRETTLHYCFYHLFLYLVGSNTCLLVDPHATTLVPRGRRIPRAAPSAADPEEKTRSRSNSNFNQVRMKIL